MNVVERKVKSVINISLGDIFKSDEYEKYYILIKIEGTFGVVSLQNGMDVWNYDNDFDELKDGLISAMHEGRLLHYPKDKYQFVLEEI